MGSKLRKCYILDIRKKFFTMRMVKHEQRGGGCPFLVGWGSEQPGQLQLSLLIAEGFKLDDH